MSEPLINRVYSLKIADYEDSIKKVQTMTVAFNKMDDAKKKLNESLQRKLEAGDVAAVKALSDRIKELEASMKRLAKEQVASAREALLQAKAEKELSIAEKNRTTELGIQARAEKDAAIADKTRTANMIQQEKELDRLIAQEEKQNRKVRETTGYYYDLLRAQKAALEAYRTTLPESPLYNQVKQAAIDAKSKVDAFNRSLSPDGTLVGEYRSGIVNAFRELGLNDVIKRQKDDINGQLAGLQKQARDLATQYKTTGAEGEAAFKKVELELRANFEQQDNLKKNLTAFAGGSLGSQIRNGIGGAFKDIKGDILRAGLAYVSFQGIISATREVFSDTVKLDSLQSSLAVVSGNQQELAINNKFLTDTTHQLGLEQISAATAFKNFYAASTLAGISADETRKIYFSAAAASANLKLSQEDTNGVLLAFSQIASKGKVQAEELRGQIGERVPGAFAIAAKAIGVTQVELNKMLQNGQVISSEFLPKFAAELQKTFGGDATKKVEGLQASINGLKNQITDLIIKNQSGLKSLFSTFINVAPLMLKLLPLLAAAFVLYTAEQLRAYVVTQLNTEATILYNLSLYAQRAYVFVANIVLGAYYGTIALLTGGLTRASIATAIFGNVTRALPLGIILTLVGLLAGAIVVFAQKVTKGTDALKEFALRQLALRDVQRQSALIYTEQISKINSWILVIKSGATSADTKRKAVEQLTKINKLFGDVIKDNVIDLSKLNSAYQIVTDSIIKQANAQASANLTAQKQQKLVNLSTARQVIETTFAQKNGFYEITGESDIPKEILDIIKKIPGVETVKNLDLSTSILITEKNRNKVLDELGKQEKASQDEFIRYNQIKEKSEKELSDFIGKSTTNSVTFEVDIAKLRAQIEALDKEIEGFQGKQTDLNKKIAERKRLQDELDRLLGTGKKSPEAKASRLTGEQKDAFKDIDAIRDEALANEKLKFAEHTTIEEQFLNNSLQINLNAADKKLKLLAGKNAEERKQIAELKLYKIEQEEETQKKIFDIVSKRETINFDDAKKQGEVKLNDINNDPSKTPLERAKAQETYLYQLQNLQVQFNDKMDLLEKLFNVRSKENAQKRKDDLINIQKELTKSQYQVTQEGYDEVIRLIDEASQRQINETKTRTANKVSLVLDNDELSAAAKARQIKRIEAEETTNLLAQQEAREAEILRKRIEAQKAGLATETEVSEARKNLALAHSAVIKNAAEQELSYLKKLQNGFKEALGNLTNFFKGIKASREEINAAIGAGLDTVRTAINDAKANYFENKRQQIDDENKQAQDRLNLEQQQLESVASSEEGKDSIRRQFDAKRKELDRQAAEDRRKLALKELTLNFAIAVVKTLAAYPFPFSLLPVAGLAIAYAIQRNAVQNQKFARGGQVQPEKIRNGRINITPNIPTQPNGDNIVATVKSGEVILNEEQQKKLGGPQTFKRIGVPGFAGGGITGLGDFRLGEKLRPPIDPASYLRSSNKADFEQMMSAVKLQAESIQQQSENLDGYTKQINRRIDRIKVDVVAQEVETKNKNIKKASAIGTL